MFEIDAVPQKTIEYLAQNGASPDRLQLAVFLDRDRLQQLSEIWLFADANTLYLADYEKDLFEAYLLDDISEIFVEEQLSTGRLIAKKENEIFLLASFTNFRKASVLLFVKYLEILKRGEPLVIDERDIPEAKCCPKCGMRYPDPNRTVCPHCMEKGKIFKRFSVFLFRYRLDLVLILLSLVGLTAMSILAPYLSAGFFYDQVIYGVGRFAGEILLVLGMIVATKVLKTLATMLNNWITSKVAAKMVFDLKKVIFGAIERLSLGFFTGRQTGGLMTQVNEDSNTIYEFFCDRVPYFVINAVQVAVLTVLLFWIQPILAALALATVPIFFLLMRWLFKNEKKLHAKRYSGSKSLNSFLADVFSGMRVVKAFSREKNEIDRFSVRSRSLARSDQRLLQFNNYAWSLAGLVLVVGNLIAWGVGGWMTMAGYGGMTYGKLLTFIAYMNMIYSPLDFFSEMVNSTADCTNALGRLFEIMDAQPDVRESPDAIELDGSSGKIEFDRVCFSYQKGRRVIDDVSFTVKDGETLGIVGHTGAGKSTLANLLMRLYDPESGEIRVGGHSVRNLTFRSLYRNIAIVSQETYLFMGTILDNIRYAKPNASFGEVVEAAKCAGAHDFIMRLPDAYHTRIGSGNQELSGGERQRISIARAVLKDPKILILDEATAAMDTATERRIQDALANLTRGKTTIMIAHRLSTLKNADKLVVIEHGKVAETGTHRELLARENGIYRKLFTLQEEALKRAGVIDES